MVTWHSYVVFLLLPCSFCSSHAIPIVISWHTIIIHHRCYRKWKGLVMYTTHLTWPNLPRASYWTKRGVMYAFHNTWKATLDDTLQKIIWVPWIWSKFLAWKFVRSFPPWNHWALYFLCFPSWDLWSSAGFNHGRKGSGTQPRSWLKVKSCWFIDPSPHFSWWKKI
jgi:hypothetical protein